MGMFRLQRKGDRELADAGRGDSAQGILTDVNPSNSTVERVCRVPAPAPCSDSTRTDKPSMLKTAPIAQGYRLTVDVQLDLGRSSEQLAKSIHRRTRDSLAANPMILS